MPALIVRNSLRHALIAGMSVCAISTACTPDSPDPAPGSVAEQPSISVKTILSLAETVLDTTSDGFASVSGGAELAIAFAQSGDQDTAQYLIEMILAKSDAIEDEKQKTESLLDILAAISEMQPTGLALPWIADIQAKAQSLSLQSQADITAKAIIAQAAQTNPLEALEAALALPQSEDYEAHFKAITLRKLAGLMAKSGDFDTAKTTIAAITMSIPYYQAMVRSDVAALAIKAGKPDLAKPLLSEAEAIARAQDNGYFVSAGLRDIGYSYSKLGSADLSNTYFNAAIEAAAMADKPNEKARATSRIATRMADAGVLESTQAVITAALSFTPDIPSDVMKGYTAYELSGSAAFAGQFDLARSISADVPDSPLGSSASMKSAAERDLAWGLARHGQVEAALEVAQAIGSPREKLQALSRIARVLYDPDMTALPRYL